MTDRLELANQYSNLPYFYGLNSLPMTKTQNGNGIGQIFNNIKKGVKYLHKSKIISKVGNAVGDVAGVFVPTVGDKIKEVAGIASQNGLGKKRGKGKGKGH